MNDLERTQALLDLQAIARDRAELDKAWIDMQIAAFELDFLGDE